MDNIISFLLGLWVSFFIFKICIYFENKKITKDLNDKQDKLYQKLIDNIDKQNKRDSVSSLKIN